jgi:hypothetical protein
MFLLEPDDQDTPRTGSGGFTSNLGFIPNLLGALLGVAMPARAPRLIPSGSYGLRLGSDEPKKPDPLPGEPGYDPDPGFSRPMPGLGDGPSTAVPMPNLYPGPGAGVRMPEHDPGSFETGGSDTDKPWKQPPAYRPYEHDWAYRGEHVPLLTRPAYDMSGEIPVQYRAQAGSPDDGPAKASSFMDPATGKVRYWDWLAEGAKRIGQGGDVLVDDSPDFMERNGIIGRPAAAIAAGNPENTAPPKDVFVESGPDGSSGELARPVVQQSGNSASPPAQTENGPDFKERPWRDPDQNTAQMIEWVAKYHGLDPRLFQRLIQIESEYNPNQVSPKGAQGLGQLMPKTAQGLGVQNAFDPFENLMGSAKNLKRHLEATDGDIPKALWRYNAGEGNYARGVLPSETKNYIRNITRKPLPDDFGRK